MPMNILFRGGGFSNKGDEAMMLTVQRELAKRIPGTNFLLWANGRNLEEAHANGLLAHGHSGGWFRRGVSLARAWTSNADVRSALRLDWVAAEAIGTLRSIDCVIDFSGYNYSDDWGMTCVSRGLAWATYCNRNKRPFVCLPQAWGPFRTQSIAAATRQLCRYSALVYARDNVSFSYLQDLLGRDSGAVRIAPDIAFLFSGESSDAGRQSLISLGIDVGTSPVVGITPNIQVYKRCRGTGATNEYVQLLVKVAEHCIHAWGASVLLLPHTFCMSRRPMADDRFLCALVKIGVSDSDRCFTLRTYMSASLIKAIESQLDFIIGSRFHSLVFALSSGIPAVALGWAHKYPELMRLVGLDGSAIIHTDFDETRITEMLDEAWRHRIQTKAVIVAQLPLIVEQVSLAFHDVIGELSV